MGEDAIDHTPEKEWVTIKLGEAFDVVGSRKMTDWKKLAFNRYEAAYELALRNHKKEDVVVKVVEPIPGDWTMVDSSYPYNKNRGLHRRIHDSRTQRLRGQTSVPGENEILKPYVTCPTREFLLLRLLQLFLIDSRTDPSEHGLFPRLGVSFPIRGLGYPHGTKIAYFARRVGGKSTFMDFLTMMRGKARASAIHSLDRKVVVR